MYTYTYMYIYLYIHIYTYIYIYIITCSLSLLSCDSLKIYQRGAAVETGCSGSHHIIGSCVM